MEDIVLNSPDNAHRARLVVAGEIRFGPLYYHLSVDDQSFGNRVFGESYFWSADSQYFLIQEWLTTDYEKGPITQLIIIDVENRKECVLSKATKGYVIPESLEGAVIIYKKHYYDGSGRAIEYEQNIPSADRWVEIGDS